jgi:anti-anti-sigma factor
MPPKPFNVDVSVEADVHTFAITGELDQATADDLRGPLMDAVSAGANAVLVDLSDCEFIDSTGLSVLVQAHRSLEEDGKAGRRFAICCPDPQVRRLLEITGLDEAMRLFDGRSDALEALAA